MGITDSKKSKKKKDNEVKDIFGFSKDGLKQCSGQDSYHFFAFQEPDCYIRFMGVYDGHGEKGKEASAFVEKEIRKLITENKSKFRKFSLQANSRGVFTKFFTESFKKIQASMKKQPDLFMMSGSCCICALIIDNVCYVINLGDSRAVLGGKLIDNIFAIQMSVDHKPSLQEEMERIKKQGGEVKAQDNGVMRIYRHGDNAPGLAVARSLGDCYGHECGISEEPQVSYRILDPSDDFLVIGSDGVYDLINSVEIVGFIYEKMQESGGGVPKEDIARVIVEECRHRWEILTKFRDIQMVNIIKNSVPSIDTQNSYITDYVKKITEECVSLGGQPENNEEIVINDETDYEKIFTGKHNIDDITAVICFFH